MAVRLRLARMNSGVEMPVRNMSYNTPLAACRKTARNVSVCPVHMLQTSLRNIRVVRFGVAAIYAVSLSGIRTMMSTMPVIATNSNAFCWPFQICDCHIANHSPPMTMKPTM